MKLDLSTYEDRFSFRNKVKRQIWTIIWFLFARPFPKSLFSSWKRFLLRLFGAKIHSTAIVYSSAVVYMPWNLEMEEYSCLSSGVDCYNVGKIKIGKHSTISQRSFLCAASHDITKANHPLLIMPITIHDQVWIGAEAFIGPGVNVYDGAVVGARACVFKNVPSWSVYGGNPAIFIKNRTLS